MIEALAGEMDALLPASGFGDRVEARNIIAQLRNKGMLVIDSAPERIVLINESCRAGLWRGLSRGMSEAVGAWRHAIAHMRRMDIRDCLWQPACDRRPTDGQDPC
ncbi:hypothetical protein [Roseicyclus elongatus]|uniref:hypothetical protein n=1 Tax=Roseicyclus elongatus TaxID=159346 RepID=UPI00046CE7DC|nr:hypothetical protein [Roseibacterium elongatum]